jgi:hypothetical protein
LRLLFCVGFQIEFRFVHFLQFGTVQQFRSCGMCFRNSLRVGQHGHFGLGMHLPCFFGLQFIPDLTFNRQFAFWFVDLLRPRLVCVLGPVPCCVLHCLACTVLICTVLLLYAAPRCMFKYTCCTRCSTLYYAACTVLCSCLTSL